MDGNFIRMSRLLGDQWRHQNGLGRTQLHQRCTGDPTR